MNYAATKTYASVGIESEVNGADPHGLILLLFRAAIAALAKAKTHMQRNEIAERTRAISHALTLINEGLKAGLDMNQGGEIAANLDALYEYMCRQLLVANTKNQPELIDEVGTLLAELKGAWEAIRPVQHNGGQIEPQDPPKRTSISYGKV